MPPTLLPVSQMYHWCHLPSPPVSLMSHSLPFSITDVTFPPLQYDIYIINVTSLPSSITDEWLSPSPLQYHRCITDVAFPSLQYHTYVSPSLSLHYHWCHLPFPSIITDVSLMSPSLQYHTGVPSMSPSPSIITGVSLSPLLYHTGVSFTYNKKDSKLQAHFFCVQQQNQT